MRKTVPSGGGSRTTGRSARVVPSRIVGRRAVGPPEIGEREPRHRFHFLDRRGVPVDDEYRSSVPVVRGDHAADLLDHGSALPDDPVAQHADPLDFEFYHVAVREVTLEFQSASAADGARTEEFPG